MGKSGTDGMAENRRRAVENDPAIFYGQTWYDDNNNCIIDDM